MAYIELLAKFVATAAIIFSGVAPGPLNVDASAGDAWFSGDQSSCYGGNYTNSTVTVVSSPGGRQLLVCLARCLQTSWCSAARYVPATGACDLASVQLCCSAQTPKCLPFYRLTTTNWPNLQFSSADLRDTSKTFRGCQDALSKGVTTSGVVYINPTGADRFPVWCNFTGGQATLTIHRRFSGQLDFSSKGFLEYQNGFGNLSDEHWLGLRRISALTAMSPMLLIDLVGKNNHAFTIPYNNFIVSSAMENYKLQVSGYVSNGNPDLDYLSRYIGSPFSAPDFNPLSLQPNCAATRGAGWWGNCGSTIYVNINGDYSGFPASCVFWKGNGDLDGCDLQYIALRIVF